MPELPDIDVYVEALSRRILDTPVLAIDIKNPFLLRTAVPDINEAVGQCVTSVTRMGKRVLIHLEHHHVLVFHLMIAGRFHWYKPGAKIPAKKPLALLEFASGMLSLTEAGSKKRASLHYVDSPEALDSLNPKGLEVLDCSFKVFAERLTAHNHTLKRSLTSPKIFSGIGNAYSDEILHKAQLSPTTLTQSLSAKDQYILFSAINEVLRQWTTQLRKHYGDKFPEKVTAFRPGMAVHGRYQQPCPICGTAIQRIRYVGNETNYCPRCQTGGKLLADRALSRLLKKDWPKTIDQLEKL